MGFYGNITNTSNTTFSFDRIYPNRLAMDANANNDGIFIGRYVLVEYDQDAAYPNVFLKDNQYYSSPNTEDLTRVRFLSGERYDYIPTTDEYPIKGKQYYIKIEEGVFEPVDIKTDTKFEDLETTYYEKVESVDGVYEEEIVQVQEISTDDKGHTTYINIGFYECNGFVTENSIKYATFKKITKDPTAKSNYIQNFAIDEKHQDAEQQKSFKGYDSTVWVKSSITTNDGKLITKYVNIADLNSVVPTFDISADAPTMSPITPHFDADSTNVYYKLHIQPQWGMRVAAANGSNSDVETYWTRENYNPSTGLSTKQYWNKNSGNWVNYDNEEEIQTFDAAIYYNRAGFEEYTRKHVDASLEDNIINIEPTGESGNLYSNHNKDNNNSTAKDIQEIRINLPAIGNMMSDAWDIIHGKQRNDYRGDGENSSLQGRLDAFQDICANQIAVKSSDEDGTIVGSKINNGEKYVHEGDILDKRLNVEDEGLLNNDDPWIRTYINTADLVHSTYQGDSGLSQEDNNGIAIQHTFHATADSETSLDKNSGEAQVSERQEKYIHAIKDSNGNVIKTPINAEVGNKTDEIKLYTPYVDATGHVVGKNIETIKLPYGYKTFTTNGINEYIGDLYTDITIANDGNNTEEKNNPTEVIAIADNTQDSLEIYTHNKWIQTKLEGDSEGQDRDKLTIAHEVHAINTSSHGTTNENKEQDAVNENNINIPDWDYDEAGHIKEKHDHYYTLPFGYKTITTNGMGNSTELNTVDVAALNTDNIVAEQTQDSLAINSGNKWVRIDTDVNNDTLTVSHDIHNIPNTNNNNTDLNDSTKYYSKTNGNTINIPDWEYDEAGHIKNKHNRTYTLPFGYKKVSAKNSTAVTAAPDIVTDVPTADNTQDTLSLIASNKWIKFNTTDSSEKNEIQLGHLIQGEVFGHTYYAKNSILLENDTYKQIPNFGDDVQILNVTVDNAGHITGFNANTITIPDGDLTDAVANGADVITQLNFDKPTGHLTSTRTNIGALKLAGYVLPTQVTNDGILSADASLNDNIGRLDFRLNKEVKDREAAIEALDVTDAEDDTKYVSGVSETNGKIAVLRKGTDTLKLNNYTIATASSDVANGDTINSAFGKIQKQIKDIYGNEKIATNFDTIKEIADWLAANDSNADKIIDSIATLNGNDTVSGSVANSIKNAIEGLDSSKSADTNKYISGITITNGKISNIAQTTLPIRTVTSGTTNGTILVNGSAINVGGLKSAAYTNSSDYARANVLDTEFTYGSDKKTIQDLMNIVKAQADTIAELTTRIEALEPESETPVEGE